MQNQKVLFYSKDQSYRKTILLHIPFLPVRPVLQQSDHQQFIEDTLWMFSTFFILFVKYIYIVLLCLDLT